ncbi:MAG: flagellar motor switch protein FliN [Treponema sp.]|nr:flagellar motor switch protein FliN [Treponema sp.]
MSDGALSQAEIDALLSGGGAKAASGGAISNADVNTLGAFLASTVKAQSANLATLTGAATAVSGPELKASSRDVLVEELPETVVAVKVDFSAGFPGEHLFLIGEDGAKAIASLMNKEEDITLDEMAMSVVGEVFSQMVGHQITVLSDRTGNKAIAAVPAEPSRVPKTVVALPGADFVAAVYDFDLADKGKHKVWEILGTGAHEMARALSGPAHGAKNQGGIGGNMSQMGMGGITGESGGGGMHPGQTNVQSVQFPNLMPHGSGQESGNIGLIMDVYMEMTVELGRTRKLIKEILAMGEGTIIELDKLAGEPVDILVNHKLIAKGEVVVIDENFGVRVTEIVSPAERMSI